VVLSRQVHTLQRELKRERERERKKRERERKRKKEKKKRIGQIKKNISGV